MKEQTNSKVPKIRFNGFEGEWVEKAFVEITTKIGSGKTPRGGDASYVLNGVPLIRSQNITDNSVLFEKVVFITKETDDVMANSRVKRNDVLLNITGASIGRSAVYRLADIANVNQHVCIIRPLAEFSADFIQLHLASTRGQRKIDNNQAGGAREGLNFQQIGGMPFNYPLHREQTQIGRYFRELDRLIGLQQRKHDKLVTLKKAMLQKMFPQPGTTTPEIRFKGFSGEWVEKKLGGLATFSKGQGYSKSDLTGTGTPIVLYGRLYVAYQTEIAEVDTFVTEKKGSIKSTGKEVVVPASGETAEDIARASAIIAEGIVLGGDLNIIFPFNGLDSCFLALTLSNGKPKLDLARRAQGKTVVHVRQADLESILILFPKLEEQQKIGTYFRSLDELISNHAIQLQKLKQIKSACLEKMFV